MLQEFESEVVGAVFLELTISILNVPSTFASITLRINGLDGNDNRIEVVSVAKQVLNSRSGGAVWTSVVFLSINNAELGGKLPLEPRAKFEGL